MTRVEGNAAARNPPVPCRMRRRVNMRGFCHKSPWRPRRNPLRAHGDHSTPSSQCTQRIFHDERSGLVLLGNVDFDRLAFVVSWAMNSTVGENSVLLPV